MSLDWSSSLSTRRLSDHPDRPLHDSLPCSTTSLSLLPWLSLLVYVMSDEMLFSLSTSALSSPLTSLPIHSGIITHLHGKTHAHIKHKHKHTIVNSLAAPWREVDTSVCRTPLKLYFMFTKLRWQVCIQIHMKIKRHKRPDGAIF